MDEDPVLRALGTQLERDDPVLAALLRAGPTPGPGPAPAEDFAPAEEPAPVSRAVPAPKPVLSDPLDPVATLPDPAPPRRRHRPPTWTLVVLALLFLGAAVRLGMAALGLLGLLLLIATPIVTFWWCTAIDELRPPDRE